MIINRNSKALINPTFLTNKSNHLGTSPQYSNDNSANILGAMDKMSIGQRAQVSFGAEKKHTNPLLEKDLNGPMDGCKHNKALRIGFENPNLFFEEFKKLDNDNDRCNALRGDVSGLYPYLGDTVAEKFASGHHGEPEILLNCLKQIQDDDIRTSVLINKSQYRNNVPAYRLYKNTPEKFFEAMELMKKEENRAKMLTITDVYANCAKKITIAEQIAQNELSTSISEVLNKYVPSDNGKEIVFKSGLLTFLAKNNTDELFNILDGIQDPKIKQRWVAGGKNQYWNILNYLSKKDDIDGFFRAYDIIKDSEYEPSVDSMGSCLTRFATKKDTGNFFKLMDSIKNEKLKADSLTSENYATGNDVSAICTLAEKEDSRDLFRAINSITDNKLQAKVIGPVLHTLANKEQLSDFNKAISLIKDDKLKAKTISDEDLIKRLANHDNIDALVALIKSINNDEEKAALLLDNSEALRILANKRDGGSGFIRIIQCIKDTEQKVNVMKENYSCINTIVQNLISKNNPNNANATKLELKPNALNDDDYIQLIEFINNLTEQGNLLKEKIQSMSPEEVGNMLFNQFLIQLFLKSSLT